MKVPSPLAGLAVITVGCGSTFAAVNFVETFESPTVTSSYDIVPGGTQAFDHPDWEITNPGDDLGVVLYEDENQTTAGGAVIQSQVIGFGGGQDADANQISRSISGFTGTSIRAISFDHYLIAAAGQSTTIQVTDPNDGDAVLYSGVFATTTSVDGAPFLAPAGDTVDLTITQSGNSNNSDTAVDNIEIVAVPEPTVAALGLLSLGALSFRRRRKR